MSWVFTEYGWRHRPWWKIVINPILRLFQPRKRYKWVIYTKTVFDNGLPQVKGYGFGKIKHLSKKELEEQLCNLKQNSS